MTREKLPTQPATDRIKNFREVALGYDETAALKEAARCLNCRIPACQQGCPVNIEIPRFIQALKAQQYEEAYQIIRQTNAFPRICGRVCPQESQCEKHCVVGIKAESVAIGNLERFVGDQHDVTLNRNKPQSKNQTKIAVVGSGPAGLSCAYDLALAGYRITIYEALSQAGGVLRYGIPEFRLPKAIVNQEIDDLCGLGVQFVYDCVIGKTLSLQDLFQAGYRAIFIGSGAGLPSFLGIAGENLCGVYSANEFLTRVNLLRADQAGYDTPIYQGQKVIVVGGGNVAMDAARVARRLGSQVHIVYRRTAEELPARHEEIEHARQEGIIFDFLRNPVEITGDENKKVNNMTVEIMELGEPDSGGRRRPVGTRKTVDIACDCVIVAIGTSPNPLLAQSAADLQVGKNGVLTVDPTTLATSLPGVYAGGDAVSGSATVILAMGNGKQAAAAMIAALAENPQAQ